MSNNVQRVLFAVVAIPIAIGIVFWGGLPLAVLVSLIAALGAHELVAIARRQQVEPLGRHAVILSALIPLGVWVSYGGAMLIGAAAGIGARQPDAGMAAG